MVSKTAGWHLVPYIFAPQMFLYHHLEEFRVLVLVPLAICHWNIADKLTLVQVCCLMDQAWMPLLSFVVQRILRHSMLSPTFLPLYSHISSARLFGGVFGFVTRGWDGSFWKRGSSVSAWFADRLCCRYIPGYNAYSCGNAACNR